MMKIHVDLDFNISLEGELDLEKNAKILAAIIGEENTGTEFLAGAFRNETYETPNISRDQLATLIKNKALDFTIEYDTVLTRRM